MKVLSLPTIWKRSLDYKCQNTDYKYFVVSPNHLFNYIENDTLFIAEMFHEREDFIYQLFGISSHSTESEDYWGE